MPDWLPTFVVRLLVYLASKFPTLADWINTKIINAAVEVCRNRPHPWSTFQPFTSWSTLTDRSWSARHLPEVQAERLPSVEAVTEVFRREDEPILCDKSTCLFPAFAQYLTDGFIRTRMPNTSAGESEQLRLMNTSNHQIDLCPLYGRTTLQTDALRLNSNMRGQKGRLKSQFKGSEEFACFHFKNDGSVDPQFAVLDLPLGIDKLPNEKKAVLFAFGGDRANATPQVAMINTLFLREHNRLAAEIERDNPSWNDERIFQTTRNVLIVIFIKIVVEEYINHIAPTPFRLNANAMVSYGATWNRPNWITTEFSLLYRWHSLLPDQVTWGGRLLNITDTLFNNSLLLDNGLLRSFVDFSSIRAGRLGAFNTTEALLKVEAAGIRQGRLCNIAPYTDYRRYAKLSRPNSFEEISKNPRVVSTLRELYGTPSTIEFYPGLFVEDTVKNSPLPPLILRLVAVDAFSQALTNPLLSEHAFNRETFSDVGWKTVHNRSSLAALLERNVPSGFKGEIVSMTRPGWKYSW